MNMSKKIPGRQAPPPRPKEIPRQPKAEPDEVTIDILEGGGGAEATPPPHPTKTPYNPHRLLYFLVWFNLALLLILIVALITWIILTRNSVSVTRNWSKHRIADKSSIQLPAGDFVPERVADMKICCLRSSKLQCKSVAQEVTISKDDTDNSLISIHGHDFESSHGCTFFWNQH